MTWAWRKRATQYAIAAWELAAFERQLLDCLRSELGRAGPLAPFPSGHYGRRPDGLTADRLVMQLPAARRSPCSGGSG